MQEQTDLRDQPKQENIVVSQEIEDATFVLGYQWRYCLGYSELALRKSQHERMISIRWQNVGISESKRHGGYQVFLPLLSTCERWNITQPLLFYYLSLLGISYGPCCVAWYETGEYLENMDFSITGLWDVCISRSRFPPNVDVSIDQPLLHWVYVWSFPTSARALHLLVAWLAASFHFLLRVKIGMALLVLNHAFARQEMQRTVHTWKNRIFVMIRDRGVHLE